MQVGTWVGLVFGFGLARLVILLDGERCTRTRGLCGGRGGGRDMHRNAQAMHSMLQRHHEADLAVSRFHALLLRCALQLHLLACTWQLTAWPVKKTPSASPSPLVETVSTDRTNLNTKCPHDDAFGFRGSTTENNSLPAIAHTNNASPPGSLDCRPCTSKSRLHLAAPMEIQASPKFKLEHASNAHHVTTAPRVSLLQAGAALTVHAVCFNPVL